MPPCAVSPSLSFHGRDYDGANSFEQLAKERGYGVHSGNEPLLIAGVATETLEILEEQPQTDVIIVPIGGGSGAAGACIVAKAASPAIKIIGVQSEAAPAAFRSWQARRLVVDRMQTVAEGLATRTAFELPQQILWQWLDAFVLVSDDEILRAQTLMIEATRNLVEAAGAAPLAAGLRLREELEARRAQLEWWQREPRAASRRAGAWLTLDPGSSPVIGVLVGLELWSGAWSPIAQWKVG